MSSRQDNPRRKVSVSTDTKKGCPLLMIAAWAPLISFESPVLLARKKLQLGISFCESMHSRENIASIPRAPEFISPDSSAESLSWQAPFREQKFRLPLAIAVGTNCDKSLYPCALQCPTVVSDLLGIQSAILWMDQRVK